MKLRITFLCLALAISAFSVSGQIVYPDASPLQTIKQSLGDGEINIVYHRPNTKGRKIFGSKDSGALVPFGEVWRAGANENTTIEITQDSMINGKKLPKGKYGFHIVPNADNWTLIFSKVNDAWGSFTYKPDQDALRVDVKPEPINATESLTYTISDLSPTSAKVKLGWDQTGIGFDVDLGDVSNRILSRVKSEATSVPLNGARYIVDNKISDQYPRAQAWLDLSLSSVNVNDPAYPRVKFSYGLYKSKILAATGKKSEAIALGDETLKYGKTENEKATKEGKRPPIGGAQITDLQTSISDWKK